MRLTMKNRLKLFLLLGFVLTGTTLFADDIKVSGVVTDKDGPVIGASILVKGSKVATVSDLNGSYTLSVPVDGILTVTSLGYEKQSLKVKGQSTVNIFLKESVQNLDEVVVVGYGTQKKRDISGSIVSLDAKELGQNTPMNIASALQGKVSGLEIVSSSEPGSSSTFKIRGASTLTDGGSNPLFIVDGMEAANIDNINPRDISSIEVLKDAASTAIYGSRSANGVVIITTKMGESVKPKVSISYAGKISELAHKLPQMSRLDGVRYETLRNYLSGSTTTVANRDSMNPAFIADNDYQSLVFRPAYTHQVDFSVSGADKKVKYYIGTGILTDEGIQVNSFNNRISSRVNVDYLASDKLTIANRFSFSITNKRAPNSYNSRGQILSRPANWNVLEPDGSFSPMYSSRANPLAMTILAKNDTKIYDVNLNEYAEYKFSPALVFKSSISGNLTQNNYLIYNPSILNASGAANSRNDFTTNLRWTHEDVLSYNNSFKENHVLNAMLGFSLNQFSSDYIRLTVNDNISDAIQTSNMYGSVNQSSTFTTWTGNTMASFFGRLGYNYKGKYIFNSNMRYDGSSRFGSDHRWGLFPSASGAWRVSDESFMAWTKPALKDAKIRLSYGVTGAQNSSDFAPLDLYSGIFYGRYGGVYPSQPGNPHLGWEQTNQLNTGVDLSFFEGRLALVFDYYNKVTKDVLFLSQIPQTNGFASSYQNIGAVNNNGFEFSVNSTNIRTRDFEWSTSVNLSFNKNMIASIPDGGRQILNNVYLLDKGYAMGTMYGWKKKSIFAYDQSNAFTADWTQLTPIFDAKNRFTGYQLNGKPYTGTINQMRFATATGTVLKGGDVMWDDVNKDGVIDANDRQVLGCGQPIMTGGFNTQFKYKGFSIAAYFSFSVGGQIFNEGEYQRSNGLYSAITKANPVIIANSWQAQGDIAQFPKPDATALVLNTREASDLWIQDGSYIRLKNLKFGYDLPKEVCKVAKVESVNLYLMAIDLFTWTNYTGYDPEIPTTGFNAGYDYYAYPKSRSISVGLNLNF